MMKFSCGKVRKVNPSFPPKARMPYTGDHASLPVVVQPMEPITERGRRRKNKK